MKTAVTNSFHVGGGSYPNINNSAKHLETCKIGAGAVEEEMERRTRSWRWGQRDALVGRATWGGVPSQPSWFLVKVVGSQTGSSGERPTNQRYIRLQFNCSISWRSDRMP